MNAIERLFFEKKEKNEGVLIPFIVCGDPNFEKTIELGNMLFDAGADILELGIPFSDPIADGPVIESASYRALKAGMNPNKAMEIANSLHQRGAVVFMTYYNILLQYGLSEFVSDCKKNGVDGIIIPDLPLEESDPLYAECKKQDIALIFLVSPTTDSKRLKQIVDKTKGYLYLVSTLGVTGAKEKVADITKELIANVKKVAQDKIPLAVGFGISKPEHVTEILNLGADGVIVGSAIVKLIQNNAISELKEFVSDLKKSTKK